VLMLVTVGVVVAGGNVSGGSETDIFAFCAFSGLTKVLLSKEFLVLGVIIIGCATSTLYTASSVNFCHKIDTIPAKSGISNYMRRDLTLSLSPLFFCISCLLLSHSPGYLSLLFTLALYCLTHSQSSTYS
jgi:hypothetical protein